jgi:hypothetical protein
LFAEQGGFIPTSTTVENVRTSDGGWLFVFYPGTFAKPTAVTLVHPFGVYVSARGVCALVGDATPPCSADNKEVDEKVE